jgi:group II intron reverse transcriptase/maturase
MHENSLDIDSLKSAFLRVKENRGGPGVDGVRISQFEKHLDQNLSLLQNELREKTYNPLPLLKILVDKGNGEPRALAIPTVKDRIAQAAVLQVIEPLLEKEFEDCSFGYRRNRSVKLAVQRIKEYYDQGFRWVVDADIDAFFDTVDHDLLMEKVGRYIPDEDIRRLIVHWIKADIWDGKSLSVMTRGIPQGSPISPLLANLFLDELDEAFLQRGYRIIRYADDFIVLCNSPEKAKEALVFAEGILEKLLLKLDEGEVVSFDQGFKYLGVTFIRSMAMVPFDKKKKERKVLYYPPPLDMQNYIKWKLRNAGNDVNSIGNGRDWREALATIRRAVPKYR